MEIGNQIKALRLRRGITQEAMAQHFGITSQAISKWERGVATPDIGLLPEISAYFGVTIDELFALSDDTRMERVQNMLWDVRYLEQADVDSAIEFLLEKARREPENGKPYAMLSELENHIAKSHSEQAAFYAKEALCRDHTLKQAHSELNCAMDGCCGDWCADNHYALIEYYKMFVEKHPEYAPGYLWLMDQLIDDNRLEEAENYLGQLALLEDSYRPLLFQAKIAMHRCQYDNVRKLIVQMEQRFPDTWIIYLCIGDLMVALGDYEQAKSCWRKYVQLQKPPRYTDGCTSISQLCEIQGDYAGAIEAVQEEIKLLETDWNTTTGETVDQHLRTIARLEKKMKS